MKIYGIYKEFLFYVGLRLQKDLNCVIITPSKENFGLQLSEEQTNDVAFTYSKSDETWYLEVVEGNKNILFEYSIV